MCCVLCAVCAVCCVLYAVRCAVCALLYTNAMCAVLCYVCCVLCGVVCGVRVRVCAVCASLHTNTHVQHYSPSSPPSFSLRYLATILSRSRRERALGGEMRGSEDQVTAFLDALRTSYGEEAVEGAAGLSYGAIRIALAASRYVEGVGDEGW